MMPFGAAIAILPAAAEMSVPQSTDKAARRVLIRIGLSRKILSLIRMLGRAKP
jgi:hypothetical protein